MELFPVIANQMIMLAIYVLIGIAAVKSRALNKEALGHISGLIMKISLPLMIFTSMPEEIGGYDIIGALPAVGVIACMYTVLYAMSGLLAKTFGLGGDRKGVYRAASLFGNVGFIGLPLVLAACPDKGIVYISVYTVIDQALLWTFGMYLTTPDEKKRSIDFKRGLRMMMNPAVAALILSLVCVFTGFRLPDILFNTLYRVGQTATPLSMIYMGGLFCFFDIRKYLKRAEIYSLILFKMIIFPVMLLAVLTRTFAPWDMSVTLALLAGLPTMTVVAMFANSGGSDGDYATAAAFMTTTASLITLPVVGYAAGLFM